MSTATMSRTDAIAESLEELRTLEQDAVKLQERTNVVLKKINDLTSSDEPIVHHAVAAKVSAKHNAKPVRNSAKNTKNAKKNTKVAPTERNYTNEMGLKKAIWDVLDRPNDWSNFIADLPPNVEGLQISEIKEIIELEKKWVSNSGDISNQLSSHLSNLKGEGLIARADGGRYYIVDGAELPESRRGRRKAS